MINYIYTCMQDCSYNYIRIDVIITCKKGITDSIIYSNRYVSCKYLSLVELLVSKIIII